MHLIKLVSRLLCWASSCEPITSAPGWHLLPESQAAGERRALGLRQLESRVHPGPTWEESGRSCSDFLDMSSEDRWRISKGQETLSAYNEFWQQNLMTCDDCYGLTKEDCTSQAPECKEGIQNRTDRWDVGLGIWTRYGLGWDCTPDVPGCDSPVCTSEIRGPGEWAVLDAVAQLSKHYTLMWRALRDARQSGGDRLHELQKIFDPDPVEEKKKDNLGWTIALSIISVLLAALGFLELLPIVAAGSAVSGAAAAASGTLRTVDTIVKTGTVTAKTAQTIKKVNTGVKTAFEAVKGGVQTNFVVAGNGGDGEQVEHNNLDFSYGQFADSATYSMDNFTTLLFKFGKVSEDEDATSVSDLLYLADFFQNETLRVDESKRRRLTTKAMRYLDQNLIKATWDQHQGNEKELFTPFITWTEGPCDDIDSDDENPHLPIKGKGLAKLDSKLTFNGTCYWLAGANINAHEETKDKTWCSLVEALPGGTHESFREEPLTNLTIADFILPSINTWRSNGYQNEAQRPIWRGSDIPDVTDLGFLDIPICDMKYRYEKPGIGCPLLDQRKPEDEPIRCSVQGSETVANPPGHWNSGTCRVKVGQYRPSPVHEMNPYPDHQLGVEIFDDLGRSVGNSAVFVPNGVLRVNNSALPYEFYTHVINNEGDNSGLEFWYGDQYWTSADKTEDGKDVCEIDEWDESTDDEEDFRYRYVNCAFECPRVKVPLPSATVEHPFPTTTIDNIPYQSVMNNETAFRQPKITNSTKPIGDYTPGQRCRIMVTQFEKTKELWQDGDAQEVGEYSVHAHIFKYADSDPAWPEYPGVPFTGSLNGQIKRPADGKIAILGMKSDLTLFVSPDHEDPMKFTLDNGNSTKSWSSRDRSICTVETDAITEDEGDPHAEDTDTDDEWDNDNFPWYRRTVNCEIKCQ